MRVFKPYIFHNYEKIYVYDLIIKRDRDPFRVLEHGEFTIIEKEPYLYDTLKECTLIVNETTSFLIDTHPKTIMVDKDFIVHIDVNFEVLKRKSGVSYIPEEKQRKFYF